LSNNNGKIATIRQYNAFTIQRQTVPSHSIVGGNGCFHSSQSRVSPPERPPTANARVLFFFIRPKYGPSSNGRVASSSLFICDKSFSSLLRSDLHDFQFQLVYAHAFLVAAPDCSMAGSLLRLDRPQNFWAYADDAEDDHLNVTYLVSLSYLERKTCVASPADQQDHVDHQIHCELAYEAVALHVTTTERGVKIFIITIMRKTQL